MLGWNLLSFLWLFLSTVTLGGLVSQEKGEGSVLHQNMWRRVAVQVWGLVIMRGL